MLKIKIPYDKKDFQCEICGGWDWIIIDEIDVYGVECTQCGICYRYPEEGCLSLDDMYLIW